MLGENADQRFRVADLFREHDVDELRLLRKPDTVKADGTHHEQRTASDGIIRAVDAVHAAARQNQLDLVKIVAVNVSVLRRDSA